MATFDLGRVTPLYKGDYSASASYELNDVVLYNGNLYWHVQATATVGIAPTDTTVWKLAFADEGVRAEIRGYADDAQASADSALASKSAAATSASNASASASQAALSAQAAGTSEGNASASASAAATSATNSAASAQSAASSAQTATDKATLASQKAAAASESASLATAKASAAATSETNAAASAQTASAKASEAASSATSAQEYDESAQQSAVNAQTAQGLAETAQTGAETAQGLAEDARDLAQQYAESIDPEHIYSAYPTDTASGAVATFTDGADDIPLKSLVVDINPVQSGSGDPSPDNVRPISGWTGANVVRYGKNYIQNSDASYSLTTSMAATYTTVASLADITSGTFSVEAVVPSGQTLKLFGYDGTDNNFIWDLAPQGDGRYAVTSNGNTIKRAKEFRIYSQPYTGGDSVVTVISKAMLVVNDTETAYEPYSGQTIPISWQTEAGTVYGGKLDVLSGVLTVDRAYEEFDLSQYSYSTTNGFDNWTIPISNTTTGASNSAGNISNIANYAYASSTHGMNHYYAGANAIVLYLTEGSARDKTAQFVYPLATPIEIQLTPHEVKSLLGANNIWADTGDTSVEYRADTKLYIERLTEPDADMIADANIVSGQYFMVGNSLYLATANIASGSAVIVGTNCTRKSLSEALNEINQ